MKIDSLKIAAINDSDYKLLFDTVDSFDSTSDQLAKPQTIATLYRLLRKFGIPVKSLYDLRLASIILKSNKYLIDCLRAY